jgi:hypothetical protein
MLDAYHQIANKVGSPEAHDLASELAAWHDAMVKHRRQLVNTGGDPDRHPPVEDCPHALAPALWRRATQVFGPDAESLVFLRGVAADIVPSDKPR